MHRQRIAARVVPALHVQIEQLPPLAVVEGREKIPLPHLTRRRRRDTVRVIHGSLLATSLTTSHAALMDGPTRPPMRSGGSRRTGGWDPRIVRPLKNRRTLP